VSLLEVADLHTHFIARGLDNRIRIARALNGVSFTLDAGRTLGLVGETGAGKSLTALSIMGLLRPPARIVAGTIRFAGRDLTAADEDELSQLRGGSMALIVQSPRTALDPLTRVGDQLIAVRRAHSSDATSTARRRAIDMLTSVGIPDPARRMAAWPHELSGGMAQRVLIAMALINEPKLLIADEPTTGLDVTVQAQVLDLLRRLVRDKGIGAIIITHDLGIVAHYCDDVAVMFAGGIVESGPVREVFASPRHPYTRGLIASTPERFEIGGTRRTGVPPPDLHALPEGCHYRDRCPDAAALCMQPPPWVAVTAAHSARCHFARRDGAP
jgi:peptide/nickel transport system ATP-binding protein/oligopeptide transport system ATP-binding protein